VLTAEQAADAIFDGAENKKLFVVKPGIFRALFVMSALFPKTVASRLRRRSKKARKTSG
jgi:uncharacterized protein